MNWKWEVRITGAAGKAIQDGSSLAATLKEAKDGADNYVQEALDTIDNTFGIKEIHITFHRA
jgi:hypothetical protein